MYVHRFRLGLLAIVGLVQALSSGSTGDLNAATAGETAEGHAPGSGTQSRKSLLAAKIEGADRILIYDPEILFGATPAPLHSIVGRDKISSFLTCLEIDDANSGFHCMCDGDAIMVIKRGDETLATVGYHHSRSLRWYSQDWQEDSLLTNESCVRLAQWFDKEGFPAFENERTRQLRDAEERESERTTFMSFFPVEWQISRFKASEPLATGKVFSQAMAKASRPEVQRCVESCFAFGGLRTRSWSVGYDLTEFARANCADSDGAAFLETVDLVQADPVAMIGAARLFFWFDFKTRITSTDRCRLALLLGDAELAQAYPGNKRSVIYALAKMSDAAVTEYLRKVARGEKGEVQADTDSWYQEPGLEAVAYLALARRGDRVVVPELRVLADKPDARPNVDAGYRLALALLTGDSLLRNDDFKLKSLAIGGAGLDIIESRPSSENLDILVNSAIEHPFGAIREDAIALFKRISGVDWIVANEYGRLEARDLDRRIREWWAANRATYSEAESVRPKQ